MTDLTLGNAVTILRKGVNRLPARDRSFAESLLSQHTSRGLSPKQTPYVIKFAQQLSAADTVAAKPEATIGDMSGLLKLFDTAKANGLKFPKIRFDANGKTVVLSVAGAHSQYTGDINVASEGSYDTRIWYGRISRKTSAFTASGAADDQMVDALRKLAENPAQEAALHGKRTGNCCLCGRTLTDPVSVANGIGPICESNWGL